MSPIKKAFLVFRTVRHLKAKQIIYRLYYAFLYHFLKSKRIWFDTFIPQEGHIFNWQMGIESRQQWQKDNQFVFLNKPVDFGDSIDWLDAKNGDLWLFTLHYFDFLNQNNLPQGKGFALINDYLNRATKSPIGLDPFVVSLKIMNWTKFYSRHKIKATPQSDGTLYAQTKILCRFLEYELLGNHLLENGFALFFAAHYFQNKDFWQTAYKILTEELNEQILNDGAHFELCPMYHKIMLFRTLDCYNLLKNNDLQIKNTPSVFDTQNVVLEKLLADKAAKMLGWLENMTYADGSTPNFGDSTEGIAPTSAELFDYAKRLNIKPLPHPLNDSGFRKLKNQSFELTAKVGKIGPDYIPGHAHADSLSFELRIKNQPILIDMGISTYETNAQRQLERSTSSHNTVEIDGKNSSEVWGSFRVGNRANSKILKDTPTHLIAQHDGYKNLNINHLREFQLEENTIKITDKTNNSTTSKAYFHASPTLSLQLENNSVRFKNGQIDFFINEKDNALIEKVELAAYSLPPQYNTFLTAQKVVVTFKGTLQTRISII